MLFRLHLVPDLTHNAIFINQEGFAIHAHILLAIHVLLTVDTIELRDSRISIGEQWKWQAVLVGKFLMRMNIIGAHTQYDDTPLLHKLISIAKIACFLRTARRIISAQL